MIGWCAVLELNSAVVAGLPVLTLLRMNREFCACGSGEMQRSRYLADMQLTKTVLKKKAALLLGYHHGKARNLPNKARKDPQHETQASLRILATLHNV